MAYVDLTNDSEQIITGNDNIVIVRCTHDIPGGRSLNVDQYPDDVINAGHVIIKETATGDYKPMPVTPQAADGAATVDSLVAGTGYANGTYENVPLRSNTGKGKGALATVVVASTVVSSVTITEKGSGYAVDDELAVPGAYAGGTATTEATVDVASLADVAAAYKSLPSGHSYAGILKVSMLTKKPFAAILIGGQVNPTPMTYPISGILSAVKTALPLIDFRSDNQ